MKKLELLSLLCLLQCSKLILYSFLCDTANIMKLKGDVTYHLIVQSEKSRVAAVHIANNEVTRTVTDIAFHH